MADISSGAKELSSEARPLQELVSFTTSSSLRQMDPEKLSDTLKRKSKDDVASSRQRCMPAASAACQPLTSCYYVHAYKTV